jgi:hypothetical protein
MLRPPNSLPGGIYAGAAAAFESRSPLLRSREAIPQLVSAGTARSTFLTGFWLPHQVELGRARG